MIKKVKKVGYFCVTKRCIHSADVKGNCNVNPKNYSLISKKEINSNLEKYRNHKKCDWYLSSEDVEALKLEPYRQSIYVKGLKENKTANDCLLECWQNRFVTIKDPTYVVSTETTSRIYNHMTTFTISTGEVKNLQYFAMVEKPETPSEDLGFPKEDSNISRHSNRISKDAYNDITLIYTVLRNSAYLFKRICDWFDNFYYFKLTTILSQEGEETGTIKKLCIHLKDLTYNGSNLYDSTFLSYAYEQKKNKAFKDLDTFTSLTSSIEELSKCSSRFYDKINQ